MGDLGGKGPVMLAVCGKGGVGKTSISAAIVRLLLKNPANRVLAIDADPAVGLASALGVTVVRTVDDIRRSIIEQASGGAAGRKELVSRLDYQLFEAVTEMGTLAFLAIGRPEGEGCYCKVNDLLREIIGSLTLSFDYVVVDGEAGVEQINRRVLERVTHLVLVSDASARGIRVAETIGEVARQAVSFGAVGLVLNRIRGEEEMQRLRLPEGINCLGWVPEDAAVRDADVRGESLLGLGDCPFFDSVARCMGKLGVES